MLDGFGAKAFALQMAPEAHLAPSKVTGDVRSIPTHREASYVVEIC